MIQSEEYLMHYGVLGMRWGIRRNRSSNSGKVSSKPNNKPKKLNYEQRVRKDIQEYHKQHKGRSKRDNYTIALRNEARKQGEITMRRAFASLLLMPVGGLGVIPFAANMYIANKRSNTLESLMDEYNIETAKRVVNM